MRRKNSLTATDLPFVIERNGDRHNFWHIAVPDHPIHASSMGRRYALEYLAFESWNPGGSILPFILKDMENADDDVAKFFVITIARALERAVKEPGFLPGFFEEVRGTKVPD